MLRHAIVAPGFERRDERGVFREVLKGFNARTLITGEMTRGAVLGNHFHKKTRIFFYLTRGSAEVTTVHVETGETDSFALGPNQGCFFEANESHAIRFLEDAGFLMAKSLSYDPADPDTFSYPVAD